MTRMDKLPLQAFYEHAAAALEADATWLRQARSVAVGGDMVATGSLQGNDARCLNVGLQAVEPHCYRRRVALDALTTQAVPVAAGALQNIDTVSLVSVQRAGPQYLYDTVKSMAQAFPEDTRFQVLVGNAQTDYVQPQTLAHALGTPLAQRLQIHPVPQEEANFMRAHFAVHRRAAWNYARALLSYRGVRGLLVVEDDVQWARNAVEKLEWWLDGRRLPVITLYNRRGDPYVPEATRPRTRDLITAAAERSKMVFECTQAMYFDASITQALGNYILLRLHEKPYDLLLGDFVRNHRLMLGTAYPSMVQHLGAETTGLGDFHQSACFVDPIP